jgi:diaminopimelate decarboxylase
VSGSLAIQGIPVPDLAREHGTPLFVYDGEAIRRQYAGLRARLHERLDILYSLKANPNVAVCALLRDLGAGAEVSSALELATALRAGVSPADIVFLGPGKSDDELRACVRHQIAATVCESLDELRDLDALARASEVVAPVALRVNPEFAVKRSGLTMGGKPRQFGIDAAQLDPRRLVARFPSLRVMGVHVYMGTRILSEAVIAENTRRILDLAERVADAQGFPLELVDVGGGLGVAYFDGERDIDIDVLADAVNPLVDAFAARHPETRLVTELGRYLVAAAGIYIVGVRYVKTSMGRRFAVADGGTNHHMAAVGIGSFVKRDFPVRLLNRAADEPDEAWSISGPLCTPNDVLAADVPLPALRRGDLVGVLRSGAYGPSASPVLFLGHGHPAEVLVHDGEAHLVRRRDELEDLLGAQRTIPTPQEAVR